MREPSLRLAVKEHRRLQCFRAFVRASVFLCVGQTSCEKRSEVGSQSNTSHSSTAGVPDEAHKLDTATSGDRTASRSLAPDEPAPFIDRSRYVETILEVGDKIVFSDRHGATYTADWDSPAEWEPWPGVSLTSATTNGESVLWYEFETRTLKSGLVQKPDTVKTLAVGVEYVVELTTDGERLFFMEYVSPRDRPHNTVRSVSVQGDGEVIVHRRHFDLVPPVRVGQEGVYWLSNPKLGAPSTLERSPQAGGDYVELRLESTAAHISGFDVYDGEIYYPGADGSSIWAVSEIGGGARIVSNEVSFRSDVRIVENMAFYLAWGPTLYKLDLDEPGSDPVLVGKVQGGDYTLIDVGQEYVYWPKHGAIHRATWR